MPVETALDAYYAFDAGAGAGIPSEDVWEQVHGRTLPGALAGEPYGTTPGTTEFEVYGDSSGRQVKVKIGRCAMFGHPGWNTAEKTLAIDTADATNPRYDIVVLRLDRANNTLSLATRTGTPAGSPTVPSLVQTGTGIYETLLAIVEVTAGATVISAANVATRRTWAIPDLRGLPTGRVFRGTNQASVGSGSPVAVTFDTAGAMSGDVRWTSVTPTRLFVPRPGLYGVRGRIRWSANATGIRDVMIYRNGSAVAVTREPAISGAEVIAEVSEDILVTTADTYFELYGSQNSGSSLTYETADYAPALTVALIRPTALS